jgi:putative aldouronate transport system substrate-binding protein
VQLLVSGVHLRAVGGKLPETLDDLYRLAVQFKSQDPAGGGRTIPILPQDRTFILSFSDFFTSFDTSRGWFIENGSVKFGPTTDGYRDALMYINKLWSEGLLWKDVMAHSNREESWRLQPSGNTASSLAAMWEIPNWRNRVTQANKDWDREFDILLTPPLKSRTGRQWVNVLNRINRVNGITRRADVKDALTFLNFWYTDEGRRLQNHGLEGTHFRVNPDGSINQTTEEFQAAVAWGAFWSKLAQLYKPEEKVDMYAPFPQASSQRQVYESIYEANSRNLAIWNLDHNLETQLRSRLTTAEIAEVNNVLSAVNTYVEEETFKFIVGQRPFSQWTAYVTAIENMQIGKVRQLYQRAKTLFFD